MFGFKKKYTEQDIIVGCQKNKRLAQQKLYKKYGNVLLGICMRYLKDKYIAEEILTAGLLKVFEKIGQFENKGSFEGWLRRIMVNECLMYLRKQKKEIYHQDIENIAEEELVEVETETTWNSEELLEMIQKLPTGYRTVFNLYAIENYTHKEIAEILNISIGTSKSQLSKARKMLQKSLSVISV